ncbi:MAG: hypothetical protein AB1650_00985 [Candidatus Omnitrophota bacterium]
MRKLSFEKFLNISAIGLLCAFGLLLMIISSRNVMFCDEKSFQSNIVHFITNKTIVPVYTNYPSFFSYLTGLPTTIFYWIKFSFFPHPVPDILADPFYQTFFYEYHIYHWLFLARFLVIAIVLASLIFFYRFSRRNYSPLIAFSSLLLIVLDPFGFYQSYATLALPDAVVASMIFAAIMILFSAVQKESCLLLYFSSFIVGLAASAKINGLLGIIPLVIVFTAFHNKFKDSFIKTFFYIPWFCFTGFIVGTPLIVIDRFLYVNNFSYETALLTGQNNLFEASLDPWWAFKNFFEGNPVFSTLIIILSIHTLFHPKKWRLALLLSLVITFLTLSMLSKHSSLYFFAIYPFVFFLFNDIIFDLVRFHHKKIIFAVISVFIGITAFSSFSQTLNRLSRPDNLQIARDWILHEIPPGSHFLLDWGYYPEILIEQIGILNWRETGDQKLIQAVDHFKTDKNIYKTHDLFAINFAIENFFSDGSYLITSSSCFRRYLETHPKQSDLFRAHKKSNECYEFLKKFYQSLLNEQTPFKLIKRFNQWQGADVYIFKYVDESKPGGSGMSNGS